MPKDSASASDAFTCEMHPEVSQAKPGECPKCGMKLAKKGEDKKK
jgi:hypothetical protein